jgi:hypothetical protein
MVAPTQKNRQNRINAARLPLRPRGNPLKPTAVSVKRPWEAEWALFSCSRTPAMPLDEFDSTVKSRRPRSKTVRGGSSGGREKLKGSGLVWLAKHCVLGTQLSYDDGGLKEWSNLITLPGVRCWKRSHAMAVQRCSKTAALGW